MGQSFSRTLCACGRMHWYCNDCGQQSDPCDQPPSVSSPHPTPRADVLAEEYKGTYLWAELDKARARIADLEEQLEAAKRQRDEWAREFKRVQDTGFANSAETAALINAEMEEQYEALTHERDFLREENAGKDSEIRVLEEQLETLREAALENAEQNAITYRLAYLLGLREEWAGAVPPPAFVDARGSIPASDTLPEPVEPDAPIPALFDTPEATLYADGVLRITEPNTESGSE